MGIKAKVMIILAIAVTLPLLFGGSSARAASDVEIENSIQGGLAWLASEQAPDGCWYGWSPPADTGLAVWKFAERATEAGLDPFDPAYVYHSQVENGLNCIFSMVQQSGGLVWLPNLPTYETGIDMIALASTKAPSRIVPALGSPVDGWTYQQVLGGMLDWMEDAQNDSGCEMGGWGYDANQVGWSDQSNTGYATLGIGFAVSPVNGFGLTLDFNVLAKLNTFVDNIQHPFSGGSGYEAWGIPPSCETDEGNILRTGNLVYEMALLGRPLADPTVQAAIGFIDTHWNDVCDGGWLDYYQATFTMTKGLQAYGIDLLPVNGDWFDQTSTYIVTHQNLDGSWGPACGFGAGDLYLETSWALLSMEPFVFEPPPPPAATSIEVSKTAEFDGRFVSGTISITNVGENPALISTMADSVEVHFPKKSVPPPLPEGSTSNWFKVADVPVAKAGVIPVGETVYIDYSFDLCDAADFSGANAMRNVVAVTLANKAQGAQTDTVVTRSESFKPAQPECEPPDPCAGAVFDICVDGDGIASAGPGAFQIAVGDAVLPASAGGNPAGLDLIDRGVIDGLWQAGDDLMVEDPFGTPTCPTAQRDAVYNNVAGGPQDCVVLDPDGSLADGDFVTCDAGAGCGLSFRDDDGDGRYDEGEDLIVDVNGNGVFD